LKASESLQQFADRVVIARREKCEAPPLGAKNKSDLETGAALEIISSKTSNAQT
jgi:hypothetical protein